MENGLKRLIVLVFVALLPMMAYGSGIRVLAMESPYDMATTVANLKRAIAAHQYRVNPQALFPGIDRVKNEIYTIYFCSFDAVKMALESSKDIGTLLPCRIVVRRVGDKIMIYAPDLSVFSKVVTTHDPKLRALCDQLAEDYQEILDEASL
jgi:uncharacterized protein (DUF302 family)